MFALLSWLILNPVADNIVLRREADSSNVPGIPSETTMFLLNLQTVQPGGVGHYISSIELLELLSFLFSSLLYLF